MDSPSTLDETTKRRTALFMARDIVLGILVNFVTLAKAGRGRFGILAFFLLGVAYVC